MKKEEDAYRGLPHPHARGNRLCPPSRRRPGASDGPHRGNDDRIGSGATPARTAGICEPRRRTSCDRSVRSEFNDVPRADSLSVLADDSSRASYSPAPCPSQSLLRLCAASRSISDHAGVLLLAGPAASHCGYMAAPAKDLAERQRSILARLIAAVEPANCERLAKVLLDEFQSIGRIWSAAPEALCRILGDVSPVVSLIIGAREAALETMAGDLRAIAIDPFSPELRRYLIASMGSLDDETLRILFLDNSRRLIADERLQQGTLSQLALYPRTIFRRALEHNAAGLILVHNHPSGDPSPSEEDIVATRHLDQCSSSEHSAQLAA
ncbi:Uncharacterized protein SGRAN_3185 [Sphingopyxis granuli]|uniref:MPN domain-containing protein n=1 Tax=Sphingopyxis granuli TaxID=267128 RepID=A0AA86GTX0_9SPHN|nr:Uncharacterized protein SGRAN_3185 [Sphingopyxis granuli]